MFAMMCLLYNIITAINPKLDTYVGTDVFIGLYIPASILAAIIHGCLFYGIKKRKPKFILVWLIFAMIGNIVSAKGKL